MMSNNISGKVGDKITYLFPNFSGYTFEVLEWISNFIPQFIMNVITYPYLGQSQCMSVKRASVIIK